MSVRECKTVHKFNIHFFSKGEKCIDISNQWPGSLSFSLVSELHIKQKFKGLVNVLTLRFFDEISSLA